MGKHVIIGPFPTEESAYSKGFEQLTSDFIVVRLSTRDEAKASRLIRAMVLEETRNLNAAFKRFRHQRGLDYSRRSEGIRQ